MWRILPLSGYPLHIQEKVSFSLACSVATGKQILAQPVQEKERADTNTDAPADQAELDREERLILHLFHFLRQFCWLVHKSPSLLGNNWRFDTVEKEPGNEKTDPDNKAKQADTVDSRQFADPLLHQFLEIGNQADGKKAEQEKEAPEDISLTA